MGKTSTSTEPVSSYAEAMREGVPFRHPDGALEYPTMRSRPQAEFTLGPMYRLLLTGSLVVATCYALWMLARIPSMPEQVPMHFASDGSVNRYGSPWEMAGLAAVMSVMIAGCAVLTRYPRVFNFGATRVTGRNIQAHYKNGVQMMVWLVLSLTVLQIVMFGAIAGDWSMTPAVWFAMALMLGSMGFFIVRMLRIR